MRILEKWYFERWNNHNILLEISRINLCEFSIISTILLFRIKKIEKFGYLLHTFAWIGKQRSFPYHAKNTIILLNCYPSKLSSNSLQSANTLETITAHVRLNRFSKRRREGREVVEGATLCICTRTKSCWIAYFCSAKSSVTR